MNYFQMAVMLSRVEGARTLAQIATKTIAIRGYGRRQHDVCCCSSSELPHRPGISNCPAIPMGVSNEN